VYESICTAVKTKQDLSKTKDDKVLVSLQKEENHSPGDEWTTSIDAIRQGVKTRLDELLGYPAMLREMTISIATRLGIPEEQIQRRLGTQSELDAQKNRQLKHLLRKLERSPLTQCILGMSMPYKYLKKTGQSEN
jgi:hypothetical protein